MPQDLLARAATALRIAGPEAVLTGHTAAYLYGCEAADPSVVHVLTPHWRRVRRRSGMRMSHGVWQKQHVETLHGLKVLALEHSLAELLCRERSPTAFACLGQALAMQRREGRETFRERVGHSVKSRADPRGKRRASILLLLASGVTDRCPGTV